MENRPHGELPPAARRAAVWWRRFYPRRREDFMWATATYAVSTPTHAILHRGAGHGGSLFRFLTDPWLCSVVLSKWTSLLALVEEHLGRRAIPCATIQGSVPGQRRAEIVHSFNRDPRGPKVSNWKRSRSSPALYFTRRGTTSGDIVRRRTHVIRRRCSPMN